MVQLVSSAEQLVMQIKRYDRHAQELAELMPFNRAWYALKTEKGWIFGPSKFVGYVISPSEYLGSPYSAERHGRVQLDKAAPALDGRVTEGVLKRWSDLVEQGHPDHATLHVALNEFCGRYGKKPNSLARISIVQTEPHPEAASSEDDLVALLAAVFRGLTPAQRSTFRKMTA